MHKAFPGQSGASGRQEQLEAFDQGAVVLGMAAGVEPEDSESQRGIDRGLGFMLVHTEDRERSSPLAQDAACIDGPERTLQIHGIAERRNLGSAAQGRGASAAGRWRARHGARSACDDPVPGKSRASKAESGPSAAPSAAGCHCGPQHPVRGGRCSARPTTSGASTCCTRPRRSSSHRQDRRCGRRLQARSPDGNHPGTLPADGQGIPVSFWKFSSRRAIRL
jgi:hypothetical protein